MTENFDPKRDTDLMQAYQAALAIRDDQPMWDDRQLAVLHQTGIPEDVSKAELAGFLHVCQRTKLDPFARQIHLIPRWSADLGREIYTPQTGIDGLRVIARRASAEAGQDISYDDPHWCGTDGAWREAWLEEGPPAAARVTVYRAWPGDSAKRGGVSRFTAVATYREFCARKKDGTPMAMWAKMPANQLAKCAEAQALRKAFPNDLAGLYAAEETERAITDELNAQPLPPKMTRHVYEHDTITRQWEADTPEHDSVARRAERDKAAWKAQEQLNRLGKWNRDERLAIVSEIVGRQVGGFAELSIEEAATVTARLESEPTPDVDAGV